MNLQAGGQFASALDLNISANQQFRLTGCAPRGARTLLPAMPGVASEVPTTVANGTEVPTVDPGTATCGANPRGLFIGFWGLG